MSQQGVFLLCLLISQTIELRLEEDIAHPPFSLGEQVAHVELKLKFCNPLANFLFPLSAISCAVTRHLKRILMFFLLSYIPQTFRWRREYFTPMKKIVMSPRKKVPLSTQRFPCQKLIAQHKNAALVSCISKINSLHYNTAQPLYLSALWMQS